MNGFDALPEFMTMDQLAERLGVTRRHVCRLVDERRVPFVRVGRFIRFEPPEIAEWLYADRVRVGVPGDDGVKTEALHRAQGASPPRPLQVEACSDRPLSTEVTGE
jgi:excisionase family DNA binding protein